MTKAELRKQAVKFKRWREQQMMDDLLHVMKGSNRLNGPIVTRAVDLRPAYAMIRNRMTAGLKLRGR